MNNYGVILNQMGLRGMVTVMQQDYIWPISRVLFPVDGEQFDDHHSFLVRYQANEDLGLDMHTDDSDVTFNVCLGDNQFDGGTLVFCGMFGTGTHRHYTHTYQHEIGRAVLHLGDHRHGADDIKSGTHQNWIVWNHNWKHRASPEYGARMRAKSGYYEAETAPPSQVCLSFTHHRDYRHFVKEVPAAAAANRPSHGWCPPPGKEYEGYGNVPISNDNPHTNDTKEQDQSIATNEWKLKIWSISILFDAF